jgi:hypothetical protein
VLAVAISWALALCVLWYFQYRETQTWKNKFEALELEAKTFYHGHVDAHFQRTTGNPIFRTPKEKEEPGFDFKLGADMVEDARQAGLHEPDYFTVQDEIHLRSLGNKVGEEVQ